MAPGDTVTVTRQRKHQQKRRDRGLCAREGCETVTGPAYMCPAHKADHARRARERRAAAKIAVQASLQLEAA